MLTVGYAMFAFLLAAPGAGAQPDWSQAPKIEVTLSNFMFAPKSVHLAAGRPVLLHIVNTASGRHNFAAKAFFDAAVVRSSDATIIRDGVVEVGGHRSVDIELVPKAGRYPLKCTHTFHKTFGMKGDIVVS